METTGQAEALQKVKTASAMNWRQTALQAVNLMERRRQAAFSILNSETESEEQRQAYHVWNWCNEELRKLFIL